MFFKFLVNFHTLVSAQFFKLNPGKMLMFHY